MRALKKFIVLINNANSLLGISLKSKYTFKIKIKLDLFLFN